LRRGQASKWSKVAGHDQFSVVPPERVPAVEACAPALGRDLRDPRAELFLRLRVVVLALLRLRAPAADPPDAAGISSSERM